MGLLSRQAELAGNTLAEKTNSVDFIFICGAVGSGNTFLFETLANNRSTYAVNEDGLGTLLNRLNASEQEFGFCSHSVDAFVHFAYRLKADRDVLILKTPSNLAHMNELTHALPNSQFILTIREPHASLVSGTRRHGRGLEFAAHEWEKDAKRAIDKLDAAIVVSYEQLMADPKASLQPINDHAMPLEKSVFAYASQTSDPYRASPEHWKKNLSSDEIDQAKRIVRTHQLDTYYQQITGSDPALPAQSTNATRRTGWRRTLGGQRRRLFKGFFRLLRRMR